jgi:hypothetical protein
MCDELRSGEHAMSQNEVRRTVPMLRTPLKMTLLIKFAKLSMWNNSHMRRPSLIMIFKSDDFKGGNILRRTSGETYRRNQDIFRTCTSIP